MARHVGNYGFDVDTGKPQAATRLVRVDPDRTVHVEKPEFVFPNGMALVDSEATMILAETFGERLSTCHVSPEGQPRAGPVLAELPEGSGADGIAWTEPGWSGSPVRTEASCLR